MALLTQKAILSTFEEMLEEMPFDKITVSALVRRCGVSSNTFYYHYQDIYDLLDVWMSTRLGMLKKSVPESKGWKEEMRVFLKYCQSHPKLVTNLLSSTSRSHLEQYIFTESDIFFYDYVRERTRRYAAFGGIDPVHCAVLPVLFYRFLPEIYLGEDADRCG